MRKEKMNIRKRVKETLALALSLLMVLSVICVPIHLDAAPSISRKSRWSSCSSILDSPVFHVW